MSYILDALQRSDSERAVGNIQTLDSPNRRPVPARRRRRSSGLGWLFALLLLLALAFALYFFRGPVVQKVEGYGIAVPEMLKTDIPGLNIGHGFTPGRITAKVQSPAPSPTPAVTSKTPVAVAPQATSQAAPKAAPAPGTPLQAGNASGVVVDAAPARPKRQPVARVNQPAAQNVPSGLAPAQQPVPAPAVANTPSVAVASPEVSNSGVSAVPQGNQRKQQAADSGEVQSSDDLPSSMRQQLPQMALNVVSYSRNDDKRFVMIDQKIYREGESVQGGMTIEEITEDGPIMSWRGRRFLMRP